METLSPQTPPTNPSPYLYYQLVYTLTSLLPPPLEDSPEALRARNHAAIGKIAAMLPVNANEADLAAQSVAARAQAEDVMRLIRENAGDLALTMRLNAQYNAMMRTSLATEARLMRVQAVRRKRESIEGVADQDAWTLHVVEQSMLKIADPDFERLGAARPEAAPAEPPGEAPEAAPPATQRLAKTVSQNKTNSRNVAFETPVSDPDWDEAAEEAEVRAHIREAERQIRSAMQEVSAIGRESPGRAG
jgi:hypothetical protein